MSHEQHNQLSAGQYYGNVVKRLRISDLVLSELKHSQPRKLPQHSHELGFFSFLLKGDYEEWYGAHIVTHRPQLVMWHPPGLNHQDQVGQRGCHFFNTEVSPNSLERLSEFSAVASAPIVLQGNEPVWLMKRLHREFSGAENGCELAIEGLLLELLAVIARGPAPTEHRKPGWLRRVETVIHDEFTAKLTMTRLAAEAGVHPVYLASIFRRFHQTTVSEYVHQLRVKAACELLRQPDASLAEIAMQLGFADQSYFSRVFHRLTGMTPKAWRTTASR